MEERVRERDGAAADSLVLSERLQLVIGRGLSVTQIKAVKSKHTRDTRSHVSEA